MFRKLFNIKKKELKASGSKTPKINSSSTMERVKGQNTHIEDPSDLILAESSIETTYNYP